MSNFAAARKNMVDCQIHTSGVSNAKILEAFETVPRECFVPKAYQEVSYLSEDLMTGQGRFLLEPAVHARMIEALDPQAGDAVLDVSLTNGYSAAILAPLVTTVITIESQQKHLDQCVGVLHDIDVPNVVAFKGPLAKGWEKQAPYDRIFMCGSVGEIPEHLIDQLAPGGKLVAVVRGEGELIGQATLVQKSEDKSGGYSSLALFEAGCPYLPGFEPKSSFSFT